jgi:hypothetical protein
MLGVSPPSAGGYPGTSPKSPAGTNLTLRWMLTGRSTPFSSAADHSSAPSLAVIVSSAS